MESLQYTTTPALIQTMLPTLEIETNMNNSLQMPRKLKRKFDRAVRKAFNLDKTKINQSVSLSITDLVKLANGSYSDDDFDKIIDKIEAHSKKKITVAGKRKIKLAVAVTQREFVKTKKDIIHFNDSIINGTPIPSLDLAMHALDDYKDKFIGSFEVITKIISNGKNASNFTRRLLEPSALEIFDYIMTLVDGQQRTTMLSNMLTGTLDNEIALLNFENIILENVINHEDSDKYTTKFVSQKSLFFAENVIDVESEWNDAIKVWRDKGEKGERPVLRTAIPASKILDLERVNSDDEMIDLLEMWMDKNFVYIPNNDNYDETFNKYLNIMEHLKQMFITNYDAIKLDILVSPTLNEMQLWFATKNGQASTVAGWQNIKTAISAYYTKFEEDLLAPMARKLTDFDTSTTGAAMELSLRIIVNVLGLNGKFNGDQGLEEQLTSPTKAKAIAAVIKKNATKLIDAVDAVVGFYNSNNKGTYFQFMRFKDDKDKMTMIVPLSIWAFYKGELKFSDKEKFDVRRMFQMFLTVNSLEEYLGKEKASRLIKLRNIIFHMLGITVTKISANGTSTISTNKKVLDEASFTMKNFDASVKHLNITNKDDEVYSILMTEDHMIHTLLRKADNTDSQADLAMFDYIKFSDIANNKIANKVNIDHESAGSFDKITTFRKKAQSESGLTKSYIDDELFAVIQNGTERIFNKIMVDMDQNIKKSDKTKFEFFTGLLTKDPTGVTYKQKLLHYGIDENTVGPLGNNLKIGNELLTWFQRIVKRANMLNSVQKENAKRLGIKDGAVDANNEPVVQLITQDKLEKEFLRVLGLNANSPMWINVKTNFQQNIIVL